MTKRAIYINKFGTFHIGHLDAFDYIAQQQDIDEIILAMGGKQYSHLKKSPERDRIFNFLAWQEKAGIILECVKGRTAKKVHIAAVDDVHPAYSPEAAKGWVDNVRQACPKFSVLFSNHQNERELFQSYGYEPRHIPASYRFTDHCVRDKIARHELWKPFFQPEAAEALEAIGIEERLEKLYAEKSLELERFADLGYEWRTFEEVDSTVIDRLFGMATGDIVAEKCADRYFVSLTRSSINLKVCGDRLKSKELLVARNGIELYSVQVMDFPVSIAGLPGRYNEFRLPLPRLPAAFSLHELEAATPAVSPYFLKIDVSKERRRAIISCSRRSALVDAAQIQLFGRRHSTLGLEGKSEDDVRFFVEMLGLNRYRARNYVQFIEQKLFEAYSSRLYDGLRVRENG